MKTTFIYSLCDPNSLSVRYIGKSDNPKKRYTTHVAEYGNYYKLSWIKSLKNKNLKPKLIIIDEVLESEWQFWEMHYISLYKSWGFKLTNLSDGGGCNVKKGIYAPRYGHKQSEETKNKIRAKKTGIKQSEETKLKRSKSLKGRVFSKETREKLSKAAKNKFLSKEYRQKISESMMGNTNKKRWIESQKI